MTKNFKRKSDTTVVVGMSGGVDSSVAALMLKGQGYRVIGLFMRNWKEKDPEAPCTAEEDHEDVVQVCQTLDIPFYTVDFTHEYWDEVFAEALEDYKAGHTPNPDILCNRQIKFKAFLRKALEIGGDFLATGHYCRNPSVEGKFALAKGVDGDKDQSYFLYSVSHEALSRVLFPLGSLKKGEVRAIAYEAGLINAGKKDSTGICFVGKRDFREFLMQFIPTKPGKFETLDGKVVGDHVGIAFYTIGQRKGLGLGGPGEPWFVVGKDLARNVVFVERGIRHPALFADELVATELSWISGEPPGPLPYPCKAKVRYRQKDQSCTIVSIDEGKAFLAFNNPQRAITLRQSVVFYDGDICLGGGIIDSVGPSYFQQGKEVPQTISPTE